MFSVFTGKGRTSHLSVETAGEGGELQVDGVGVAAMVPAGASTDEKTFVITEPDAAYTSKRTLSFPSTAAAETQNAASASTYAMGLRALLEDTPSVFRPKKPNKLIGDNSASVQICNGNQSLKPLSRFMARRINVIREHIAQRVTAGE